MTALGPFLLGEPWALAALAALPIIWWILYVWVGWTVFGIFTLGMAYKRRQRQPLRAMTRERGHSRYGP